MSQEILTKVIDHFLELSPMINRRKPFLKSIEHRTGRIIQIDKVAVKEFKACLIAKVEYMKRFVFEIEMNEDYVKKRLQDEREKVFNEAVEEEEERVRCGGKVKSERRIGEKGGDEVVDVIVKDSEVKKK